MEAVWIPLRLQASGLAAREATARLGMLSGMVTPVLMLPCVFTGSLSMVLLPRIALAEKEPKELRRLVGKCFLTAAPAGLGSTGAVWLAAPLLAWELDRMDGAKLGRRAVSLLCCLCLLFQGCRFCVKLLGIEIDLYF